MKRDLLNIDTALILAVLAVTIPQAGYVIASLQQPGLWWVGYIAAAVFDLFCLRFAYSWQRSRWGGKAWRVRGAAFVIFAVFAWVYQFVYLAKSLAAIEAVALSGAWPLALVFLAVHRGIEDDRQERQDDTMARQQPVMTMTRVEPKQLSARTGMPDDKRAAVLALAGTMKPADIANATGVPVRTVYRYLKERTCSR